MKGITLLSDIFLIIVLLAITVIMSVFIWALIITFTAESKLMPGGMPTTRNVELTMVIKPITYDSLMSAFLECDYQGMPMKEILEAVAIQQNNIVWLEGSTINASLASESFLTPQINGIYLLKVGDVTVVESGQMDSTNAPLGAQKVSTELFTLNGKDVYMQLFVVD